MVETTTTDTNEELFAKLAATTEALRQAFSAADAGMATPREGEWSLADVLQHIRASDAIISTRVYQVLTRDEVPLAGFDERVWGALYGAAGIDAHTQLEQFALRRAEFVAVLRSLMPAQLSHVGQHEERGPMTVIDLCQKLADHEADHRIQIEALTGRSATA